MKSLIKLFLILITLAVTLFAMITRQLGNSRVQLLIAVLAGIGFVAFLFFNLTDRREERIRRKLNESAKDERAETGRPTRMTTDTSFTLRERKSGLTWGGGNIKASEATRGTKRKFLGR